MIACYSVDSMEGIPKLRLFRELVMDELCLKSFLRSHDKDCLGKTSAKTAHEVVERVLLSENVLLYV